MSQWSLLLDMNSLVGRSPSSINVTLCQIPFFKKNKVIHGDQTDDNWKSKVHYDENEKWLHKNDKEDNQELLLAYCDIHTEILVSNFFSLVFNKGIKCSLFFNEVCKIGGIR